MSHRRRRTLVLALLLGGSVLPLATAPPAQAAPGCLHDVPVVPILTPAGCDDTTPPVTELGTTAPRITASGWINKRTLRVGYTGRHTDADTDPIAFQCSLGTDPAVPTDQEWYDCPEDRVFRRITPSPTPYVLWIRAVDSADLSVRWSDGNLLSSNDEPVDDVDPTPVRLTFRIDNVAPDTRVAGLPRDPFRPDLPMVGTARPRLRLSATEAATFQCTVNSVDVPCTGGTTTLPALRPGDQVLQVAAVDRAGNVDPSPATVRFAVPANLAPRGRTPGWKQVRRRGYLGGDYLRSSRPDARMVLRVGRFRELRLLATTGPRAGVVEVRLGRRWQRVDLRRTTTTVHDQVRVRDHRAAPLPGRVEIRVVRGRVQLDGILAH